MAIKAVKKKAGDQLMQQALEEEHRIRQAFKDKNWAEIKSSDSWVIFKVMSEFVEGFEKMAKIGPCVTIFGSARVKPSNPYYKMAEAIAERLVQQGYGVITGRFHNSGAATCNHSVALLNQSLSNSLSHFIIWIARLHT